MAPGRDIAAAALDGDHAVADREAGNPAGDMQVLQAAALLLCEEADLLRGKADGLERIRIDFFIGLLHLLRPETVFRRTVLYGLAHYPEKSEEEQWKRFVDHMENKYSAHGYIKLWIQNSPNQEALRVIREIIVDKTLLRKEFDKYFGEETI